MWLQRNAPFLLRRSRHASQKTLDGQVCLARLATVEAQEATEERFAKGSLVVAAKTGRQDVGLMREAVQCWQKMHAGMQE